MKFGFELIKALHGCNPDGTKVSLSAGDEVYLKLDWPNMKLTFFEEWVNKYPDGWVKGTIYHISDTGRKIKFHVYPHTYFLLNQKDILAVSDKAPNYEVNYGKKQNVGL